jgi:hypothetical protein
VARRARLRLALVWLTLAVSFACGGESPTAPAPQPQPQPPPAPVNQVPVIESVVVSTPRVEADTDVTVTATVRDAETPVDQLRFAWAADVGTFSGPGASVQWRVPRGVATPAEHAVRLTVTEVYGTADASGNRPQHTVSGSSPLIRVHDSPAELGALALRFLRDFANSTVPADVAIREFSDSCAGKAAERIDIADNRRDFDILSSQLSLSSARVRTPFSRGDMTVRCAFSSRRRNCPAGSPASCRVGAIESVEGNCNLTAVYEAQRWQLCESTFDGRLLPSMFNFFGRER